MKKLLVIILSFSFLWGYGQGINFEKGSLSDALEKAKSENKLVFVDGYTTWCGPCKWLSHNIFTQKEVGDFYNKNFINQKLDLEKGEGIDFAKKHHVTGYPTLFFINGEGELVHRSVGARPAEEIIDLGKAALDPERQYGTMKKRYDAGEKDPDFLRKFAIALTGAGMPEFGKIAEQYMDTQNDWLSPENMDFIFKYSEAKADSKIFQFMLKHRDKFIEKYGVSDFEEKVDWAIQSELMQEKVPSEDREAIRALFAKYYNDPSRAKMKADKLYFNRMMYTKDPVKREKFLTDIQLFLAELPDVGWSFYNAVAWEVHDMTDDKEVLKKALLWAKKSVEEDSNFYNNDTVAAILVKLGNKKEAKPYAEKAIELAKKEGQDSSETQKLLDIINGH